MYYTVYGQTILLAVTYECVNFLIHNQTFPESEENLTKKLLERIACVQ